MLSGPDQALIFVPFLVCFQTPKGHPGSVYLIDIKLKVCFAALQEKANGNVLNFSNPLNPSKVDSAQCTKATGTQMGARNFENLDAAHGTAKSSLEADYSDWQAD